MEIDSEGVPGVHAQGLLEIDDGVPEQQPRRRALGPLTEGKWRLLCIVGRKYARGAGVESTELPPNLDTAWPYFLGVGVYRWECIPVGDPRVNEDAISRLLRAARGRTRKQVSMYVVYRFADFAGYANPVLVSAEDVASPRALVRSCAASEVHLLSERGVGEGSNVVRLEDALARWTREYGVSVESVTLEEFDTSYFTCVVAQFAFWAVALGRGRLPRGVSFVGEHPPKKRLREAANSGDGPMVVRGVERAKPMSRSLGTAEEVAVILDWIDATSELKQLRKSPVAKTKWAVVLARHGPETAAAMGKRVPNQSYGVLQRSRSQLDVACMAAFRWWWDSLPLQHTNVYVFTDGSPQWRGAELFATSIDIVVCRPGEEQVIIRKMLPVLQLGLAVRSALGKATGVLWQLFLLLGPDVGRLRGFLSRVRSLTTDFGVEHKLPALPDVLPNFVAWATGKPPPADMRKVERLFPMALLAPGWGHLCDGLLRKGLFGLPWFPKWLEVFKGVLMFFGTTRMTSSVPSRKCQTMARRWRRPSGRCPSRISQTGDGALSQTPAKQLGRSSPPSGCTSMGSP